MNQLIAQATPAPLYLRERRKDDRSREMHLLVITSRGTGKIVDISRNGLSFGCLYHHTFPEIWSMDLINAKGFYLKGIMVRKVWERTIGHPDLSDSFELEIGVEFMDLTPLQENELDFLFNDICYADTHDTQQPCLL
jgi:hypothetical protein